MVYQCRTHREKTIFKPSKLLYQIKKFEVLRNLKTILRSLSNQCLSLSLSLSLSFSSSLNNIHTNTRTQTNTAGRTKRHACKVIPKMCLIVCTVNSTGAVFFLFIFEETNHKLYCKR